MLGKGATHMNALAGSDRLGTMGHAFGGVELHVGVQQDARDLATDFAHVRQLVGAVCFHGQADGHGSEGRLHRETCEDGHNPVGLGFSASLCFEPELAETDEAHGSRHAEHLQRAVLGHVLEAHIHAALRALRRKHVRKFRELHGASPSKAPSRRHV